MALDLVQISFAVPKIVATNLMRRAAPLNIRMSEYARRLFDAAYAARIADERGEESGDRALDRQVRDVFLLADCEPEFIADALGLPVERVQKILDGWRRVARELNDAPQATAPSPAGNAPASLPPPAAKRLRSDSYPAEQVETIRAMWAEGRGVREIAAAIGKPEGALSIWAGRHRDICPSRRGGI